MSDIETIQELYEDAPITKEDEIVEVFRVFPVRNKEMKGSSHDFDECNFSVIFRQENDEITEFGFDSRRFERVE